MNPEHGTIYEGDCLDVMRSWPDGCIDTVLTDPPYGLGFMGKDWDHGVPGEAFWREILRVCKPGATLLAFGGTRTYHRLACAIEDAGWQVFDCLCWLYGSGFPKSLDISKALDKEAGAEREVVGIRHTRTANEKYGNGKGTNTETLDTAPATDLAKQWDGWGTALKPAWEPIIAARKPNCGSFAANAREHGVAGLNIDGGRIGHDEPVKSASRTAPRCSGRTLANGVRGGKQSDVASADPAGRWPANVVLDEAAARQLDEQSGEEPSRFFYTAKASAGERNAGCGMLELKSRAERTGREEGSAGLDGNAEKGYSQNPYANGGGSEARNHHPTVKPVALMRWLAVLTATPTGGLVLDPFAGSGTTGVACNLVGRPWVMIELDPEYVAIAKARTAQQGLFTAP